ncbi:MAG: efflux RND transporter permease subunit [Gammaproteobacteria bacterium]|nr:efflux RND transporter permease subunit [Gammaproteobacteria bacterium]
MFNVSSWSIRNPLPVLMLFVVLCVAGVLAFKSNKIQQFPDLDLPTIKVVASMPGASPQQLESDVARKIENAIAPISLLRHTITRIEDGVVSITADFNLEKSTQEALDEVRSAVQGLKSDLPADLSDPVVNKLNLAGTPVLAYTVKSRYLDDTELSWLIDNDLTKALLAIKGVGAVQRVGGVQREVQIELNTAKMQALGLTPGEISRQIRHIQQDASAGSAKLVSSEQPIRLLGSVSTADELKQLQLKTRAGEIVWLEKVAEINDTVAETRSIALVDGSKVVGMEIMRSKGASEIEVGKMVPKALSEFQKKYPDLEFSLAFDFVTPVEEDYHGSLSLLYEGAILAVLVVWAFLRNWRATFVSSVALPMSVIPTFLGMSYMGFSINVVTLLALSLVIGVLVDDAIVEVENIVRHLQMNKTPYQAAMEATQEIGLAVIATTFTIVAVFLPTAFMTGIPGKFFKQFGWTTSIAVLTSLLVARMLTPMMAAYMLKPIAVAKPDPWWLKTYMRMVHWCLRFRVTTLLLALAFFMASIMLIPLLPTGFIPPDDNSQTQVYLELPPGATFADTLQISNQARGLLVGTPDRPGIQESKSIYTTIGGGSVGADPFSGAGGQDVRKATLTIQLKPRGERPKKQIIENQIRQVLTDLPATRYKVGLGGSGEKYVLVLTGDDPKNLLHAAAELEKSLRQIPGLGAISSTASLLRQQVNIIPRYADAARLGVTSADLADALRIATIGDYRQLIAKLNLAQRQIPIVVKLPAEFRQNLDAMGNLLVPSTTHPVLLKQVADIELSSDLAVIDRYDRLRNITIEVEVAGQPLGEVTKAVQNLPVLNELPSGVKLIEVGDSEMMAELFASFSLAMLIGLLSIYAVLVLLFKGVLHPITILIALPLALGGAFIALLIAQKSFSMPSLIGLVMLMGVATKNSILLVDYALEARKQNPNQAQQTIRPALLEACHKRARPIIMTTLAMGAGMLPVALEWGASDGSFRSPMAVAVIGGLITSTVLSLLVVPVVFTYLDDLGRLLRRLWTRYANIRPRHQS